MLTPLVLTMTLRYVIVIPMLEMRQLRCREVRVNRGRAGVQTRARGGGTCTPCRVPVMGPARCWTLNGRRHVQVSRSRLTWS